MYTAPVWFTPPLELYTTYTILLSLINIMVLLATVIAFTFLHSGSLEH